MDSSLNLDTLSSLFTRLILQNQLTRLAGDIIGRGATGGGGLWGCSLPPSPSCSSCHPHHDQQHGCVRSSSADLNTCEHANNLNMASMCHTCPAATHPYMGASNVFVIPTGHVQQQRQQQQQPSANLNQNNNNLNMFLNGLGLAWGVGFGGGSPMNVTPGGCTPHAFGSGAGAPISHDGPSFSCSHCNFQMM